jgi:hypothetical protein
VPKNEDGEFELILGNRQLLSVFFIVVVLLGVFFTMGYIVGRSSAPVTGPDVTSTRKPETKPLVVESAAPAGQPSAATETAASQPVSTAEQKPPEAVRKPEPKAEPIRAEKASPIDQPVAGQTYLQLTAISRREADVYIDVLRKNGFKAFASEVPEKPGLFRILVGPLKDGEVNKTRADLQSKSFPGNIAIKKTF